MSACIARRCNASKRPNGRKTRHERTYALHVNARNASWTRRKDSTSRDVTDDIYGTNEAGRVDKIDETDELEETDGTGEMEEVDGTDDTDDTDHQRDG